MRMTKLFVAGSAIALGAAMTLGGTPAAAQATCELSEGGPGDGGADAVSIDDLACGQGAYASGGGIYFGATAVGSFSDAVGSGATAFGSYADATGDDTTAIGFGAVASDTGATALGAGAAATGYHSIAIGLGAVASGDNTVVVGENSDATGAYSTVLGNHSSDGGFTNSVALGANTTNTADNQVHVGGRTIAGVADGLIAAGSDEAVNGDQINTILLDQAVVDLAQDTTFNTFVVTQDARDDAQDALIAAVSAPLYFDANSVGAPANAVGVDSIAMGGDSVANGASSIALGENATTGATHTGSVAIGANTATTAANQVALGGRTLTQVANGTLSATSTDAVTGQQLFATNTNVTNVTNRVTAAEADILALEAFDVILDDRIDRTDDRARGGTAVAIAMGGAMFLPDKTFNLTGNVGYYRRAWAAAVNIGAMLGDSAAFNAGIGHGVNRGGKTGARAGFTVGW